MMIVRKSAPFPKGLVKCNNTVGFKNSSGNIINVDPYKGFIIHDPLTPGRTAGNYGFVTVTSGAGSSITIGTQKNSNHIDGLDINTGTTTTGRVAIRRHIATIANMNEAKLFIEWETILPTLSDGTDTYTAVVGFHDSTGSSSTATDGAYFLYSPIYGANWQSVTADGNLLTTVDTGIAVTTSWTTYRVETNYTGTSCDFYIDGVLASTHTTNIFTNDIRACCPMVGLYKSAGTNNRLMGATNVVWGAIYQNSQL